MNKIEHGHLPRLAEAADRGFAVVHWTMTIRHRQIGWLNALSHSRLREALLHTAVKYDLLCPVYCLMPHHAHLIWMGMSAEADQLRAAEFFRRIAGEAIAPHEWQWEAYDHVLREEERKRGAFAAVCRYVLANPVKAKLADDWSAYSYSGACLAGYPDVEPRRADYWDVFWKIYVRRRKRTTLSEVVSQGNPRLKWRGYTGTSARSLSGERGRCGWRGSLSLEAP